VLCFKLLLFITVNIIFVEDLIIFIRTTVTLSEIYYSFFQNEVRQIVACETKLHLRMQREYDENQGDMYLEERDGR
jgi:hypothetical protein